MWSFYYYQALDLDRRRREEADRHLLAAEAGRAQRIVHGPHPLRRLGARLAVAVGRAATSLARALDERALEAPRPRDAAS